MTYKTVLETGMQATTTVQAAGVRGPLLAVSGVNDQGNVAWFDRDDKGGSFILPGGEPEMETIRNLVQQMRNKAPVHRQGGVYKVRRWAPNDDKPAAPRGFPRPGKK